MNGTGKNPGKVRRIFTRYSDIVETVGLDEAYLDVSHYPDAVPVARELKERVRAETGLTCSIGLSYNKSMAKIASDLKKPNAFVIIRPEQALHILKDLPIGALHGIGKKIPGTAETNGHPHGPRFLAIAPGKSGPDVRQVRLRSVLPGPGKDDREIVPNRPRKSHSLAQTDPARKPV